MISLTDRLIDYLGKELEMRRTVFPLSTNIT